MKYIILLILIFSILLFGILYFVFQSGKICINNERVGFFLLKNGYRAWWVRYSNGLEYLPNNKYKNLWCIPKFEHCDARPKYVNYYKKRLYKEDENLDDILRRGTTNMGGISGEKD